MARKIATLSKRHCSTGGGNYGSYYQISARRGIKVLDGEGGCVFDTQKEATQSDLYDEAKEEARLLRKARRKTNKVPTCYGVRLVKQDGRYAVGIEMEHAKGRMLSEACIDSSIAHKLAEDLENELRVNGISHGDLHWDNIMYYKGKVKAIDFSPGHVTVK